MDTTAANSAQLTSTTSAKFPHAVIFGMKAEDDNLGRLVAQISNVRSMARRCDRVSAAQSAEQANA